METTERIVEAYVRYTRGWFTLPNIRCTGQLEVDLLAVDATTVPVGRYHIESGISISSGFSKLTNEPYSLEQLRIRTQQASQRRTLGYFAERKFGDPAVVAKLQEFGFHPGNYHKIVVSWGWDDDVLEVAKEQDIELWDLRKMLNEIATRSTVKNSYWTDDTMRTLQLMAKASI